MNKLFLLIVFNLAYSGLFAQTESEYNEKAHYREFDFWIGEWEVFQTGTKDILGYSKVDSIVNGFAIQETFRSSRSKYNGISLNKYNTATGQWEQYWVDSAGLTLFLKGRKTGNKMVMENMIETEDGILGNRITWIDNEDGSVQQIWEQSSDEGESWLKIFDGTYKKPKNNKNKKSQN